MTDSGHWNVLTCVSHLDLAHTSHFSTILLLALYRLPSGLEGCVWNMAELQVEGA